MYKHTNSASRIHAVLSRALQQGDQATFAMWANVFDVSAANDLEKARKVIAHLHWFNVELQLLATQVQQKQLSPHLYDSAFARIEQVTSPLHLQAGWHGTRGNLTPDVLLAIAFCNELLPDEEASIAPDELASIASEVKELAELLKTSSLPDRLKQLISHHIDLILTALAQYQVFGAKALREAGRTALGEIIEAKDTVAPQQASPEMSKLEKLWKHINTVTDIATQAEKAAQLGNKGWELLSTWLQS